MASSEKINGNLSSIQVSDGLTSATTATTTTTATTATAATASLGATIASSSSPTLSFLSTHLSQTSQKYSLVNNVNVENLETIAYIIEKMESIINNKKNINYKTLIINSYNRDWTIYNNRNNLSLSINIDLTKNIIEPKKLLMPKYVKNITPYITMTINDGKKHRNFNLSYVSHLLLMLKQE